jgi:NAD(P)-dependent dehydrogenase (short-subunit alcohol dehydrogenase family)
MDDLVDQVAVVTGAASGIGRGIARLCLSHGMRVILADVENSALEKTVRELDGGENSLGVPTDVSDFAQVNALADRAVTTYGSVKWLFNNAGVSTVGSPWEATLDDWTWVIGVNLWGAIHGIKAFVPIMIEQQTPCYVVNTASAAGLVFGAGPATYATTKHAVVGLTEDLYFHIKQRRLNIGVSVLCPGLVQSNLTTSARNRPSTLGDGFEPVMSEQRIRNRARLDEAMNSAMTPDALAKLVLEAMEKKQLYIHTGESSDAVARRAEHITNFTNP